MRDEGYRLWCETKNVIDDRASFQLLHHIAPLVPKVVVVDKGKGTRNSSMNHMEVVLRPFTFCVRVCLLRYLLEKKMWRNQDDLGNQQEKIKPAKQQHQPAKRHHANNCKTTMDSLNLPSQFPNKVVCLMLTRKWTKACWFRIYSDDGVMYEATTSLRRSTQHAGSRSRHIRFIACFGLMHFPKVVCQVVSGGGIIIVLPYSVSKTVWASPH